MQDTLEGKEKLMFLCNIEDITVNPGDVALGDECGVVVVPGELFPQALRKAMQIKEDEKKIAKKWMKDIPGKHIQ